MSINDEFTDRESDFQRAFAAGGGTLCATTCACGRTYFVTHKGHGDYMEGELEEYIRKANDPKTDDQYIECSVFDTIETVIIDGKECILQCECDKAQQYMVRLERDALRIIEYLKARLGKTLTKVEESAKECRDALDSIGTLEAVDARHVSSQRKRPATN